MKKILWLCLGTALCIAPLTAWPQEEIAPAPAVTDSAEAATNPAPVPAPAPVPPASSWKPEAVGQMNLAQNSFDNWTQGGTESLAWQATLQGKLTNDAPEYNWANSAKLAFGQIKVGAEELKKSVDEIRLESVLSYKLKIQIDPYVGVKAETQFTTGYDYKDTGKVAISAFLDPGYFTESLGVGYNAGSVVKTRLGFAAKQTVTNLYPAPYADDPQTPGIEKIKSELGLESVTDLSLKLTDTILFTSTLEAFSNLKATDQIDVRWDNLLSTSLSTFLTMGFNVQLYYNKDVSTKRQIKEALTLGLTYTLI
ncbi:MAG: DUF3078 domain-containing protein [candidate division FCPU426 bacterium]